MNYYFPIGVVRALSIVHPRRLSLPSSADIVRFISAAHCAMVWVFPLNSIRRDGRPRLYGTFDAAMSICIPRSSRSLIVSRDTPVSRDNSANVKDWPRYSRVRLVDVLLACSIRVAQRQLSLVYGFVLSILSMECSTDGRGPMSAQKTEKSLHNGSTVIPFAPYRGYDECFGFVHRFHMLAHTWYSAPRDLPCLSFAAICFLRVLHVQRSIFSFLRFSSKATTVAPQMQRHSHWYLRRCSSDRAMTVKDPNRAPMGSMCGSPSLVTCIA